VSLPEENAIPLPEELDPVEATAVPDAIATPVHVAGRAGIVPGERVAVVAAGGGLGIHMVQMAGAAGASVAGLEVAGDKLAFLADELGVEAIDSSDFGRAALPSAWGGAADVVVDFLGCPASLRWSLNVLAPGGRLVVLTTFPGVTFEVSPRKLVFAESAVLGSRYCSRHELQLAGRLVAEGRIRPIVTRRVPLEDVGSVLGDLRRGALLGRGAAVIAGSGG
jgi:acryloyl-coenzyme A reductase